MTTSTTDTAPSKKTRILFFTPFASRTGSEVMLLYILRHFDRTRFEAGLVSFEHGELLNELPPDVPYFIAPGKYSLVQKISYHLGRHPTRRFMRQMAEEFRADIWYVNTIMLPDVVSEARRFNIKVITHIHELVDAFATIKADQFSEIINHSRLLLGCSDTVCTSLKHSGAANVKLLYSFVVLEDIQPAPRRVAEIRKEWGAGPNDFVWVMSGTTAERKGFDLLPEIAKRIAPDAKVHLVWLGKLLDNGLVYYTKEYCKNFRHVAIHLEGAKHKDYYSYLAAADGFMMTSRQEPLGLVLVEAAWLQKPIVTFDSGGPAEFVTEGIGTVVGNLDLDAFVTSMHKWQTRQFTFNPEAARNRALQFGAAAKMEEWEKLVLSVI